MPDLSIAKQAARTELKKIRATLPESLRSDFSGKICDTVRSLREVQSAKVIFAFISYGNEVHTHDLLKYFLNKGIDLAVPKILPEQGMVAMTLRSWEELVCGQMGILVPRDNVPLQKPFDIILTPGLGFTRSGHRIGYGRGYYDRWFSQHPSGLKIGIAFEDQLRETLPINDRDIPVDIVITEKQLIDSRAK